MFKELIKLANHLDSRGFVKEADYLDRIIKKATFKYNYKNYDKYDDFGLITVKTNPGRLPGTGDSSQPDNGFFGKVFLNYSEKHLAQLKPDQRKEFDDAPGQGMIIGNAHHEKEQEARRLAIESAKSPGPLPYY